MRMEILKRLLERNLINEQLASKLQEESRSSGKPAEQLLLDRNLVEEDLLYNIKAEALQIPLRNVEPKEIPLKVLELIPEDSAKHYQMIPLAKKGDVVEVGMVAPEDVQANEALNFLSRQGNFSFDIALITPSLFEAVMRSWGHKKEEVSSAIEELQEEIKEKKEEEKGAGVKYQRLVEEAPITKVVAVILRNAVEGKASDIHIEPAKDQLKVRFRLLGELYSSLFLPKKVHQAVIARVKILSNLKIDEQRIPQDGRFTATIDGRNVDFRVSTFPTALGEKVAIRVLDPDVGLKSFEELGLEGSGLKKAEAALKRPFGLILVTGPTGSGKTTTLYAMLQSFPKDSLNMVSLEDPVEYLIAGVNQSQVKPEIGYGFAEGLRQVLRQDPDVIMVGEVRDKDTASLTVHSALTGHVVLSTLHTNNAAGVIPRLLDMEVDKYLIPSTLAAVLSQRLVRRLCDDCKEKVKPKPQIKALVLRELEQIPQAQEKTAAFHVANKGKDLMVFEPRGCKVCAGSGYVGRIGVFEVLEMTDELAEIVLGEPSESAIEQEAQRQGMLTLRQDGMLKVVDGLTTVQEVIRVTEE